MRTLLIGAMSAALIGCSCLKPAPLKPDRTPTKIKYTTAAKTSKPSTPQPGNQNGFVEKQAQPPATLTPSIPSSAETSDSVLKKAKTTTAATLENPASAEFDGMKRAVRKDTMGQPIDTICGYVKGKKASGEETGERPFLYLVKEDKAFIDDGNPDSVAATAYRAICTNPDLHGQQNRE
jgi:hypothetical protein